MKLWHSQAILTVLFAIMYGVGVHTNQFLVAKIGGFGMCAMLVMTLISMIFIET
jgi:hypothetical protein